MKKIALTFFIFFTYCCIEVKAQVKHTRVFVLDSGVLANNKNRLLKKDALLLPAYKLLLQQADSALLQGPFSVAEKKNVPPSGDKHDYMSLAPYFWPDPSKPGGLPYMRKDGVTNPEVKEYLDKEYMPKMCSLVNTLALAYYFSNDESYAKHAAALLTTWFLKSQTKMNPNLNYGQAVKGVNDGRGAGLIDTRHFIMVVDAIGLIQQSKNWSAKDQAGMKQWFAEFLHWMQTSKNGVSELNAKNNHGTWYDAQRLAFALFIDSTQLAKKIVASATVRLHQQMNEGGRFPAEIERTTSLHYSSFNLQAFFNIAQMAEKTGFDLWHYASSNGASLVKAFNAIKPYIANQQQWDGPQIKPYDFEGDAFPLLTIGAPKLGCSDCLQMVKAQAGKKAEKSRLNLLY